MGLSWLFRDGHKRWRHHTVWPSIGRAGENICGATVLIELAESLKRELRSVWLIHCVSYGFGRVPV